MNIFFHFIQSIKNSSSERDEETIVSFVFEKTNIVLKGSVTLICSYDGKIVYNRHTSSDLAVIGSGDVLSGLIASLVGEKKMNPFLAACAAAWIHGDIAKNYGKGLIAEDIIKGIPSALKRLKNGKFIK